MITDEDCSTAVETVGKNSIHCQPAGVQERTLSCMIYPVNNLYNLTPVLSKICMLYTGRLDC